MIYFFSDRKVIYMERNIERKWLKSLGKAKQTAQHVEFSKFEAIVQKLFGLNFGKETCLKSNLTKLSKLRKDLVDNVKNCTA